MFFLIDHLLYRDDLVEHLELILPLDQEGVIRTFIHQPGLQGNLEKRKIYSQMAFQEGKKKLFDYILHVPFFMPNLLNVSEEMIIFSNGLIPVPPLGKAKLKFYYLHEWIWDELNWSGLSWWKKILLKSYEKRVLLSLQQSTFPILVSSQVLAKKLQLNHYQCIASFYKSEDFPLVEMEGLREAYSLCLDGVRKEDSEYLQTLFLQDSKQEWFIFGKNNFEIGLPEKVQYYETFCAGQLQAAFLQSKCFISFGRSAFPKIELASLSCGVPIVIRENLITYEFIPTGLRLSFSSMNELGIVLQQLSMHAPKFDGKEMRRFALRFNEKHFKDKVQRFLIK